MRTTSSGSRQALMLPETRAPAGSVVVLAYVVGAVVLLAAAAQVRIPIPGTDVPITLQLLAILLVGFVLRPSPAVSAVMLYLGCGVAGLPVFAPQSAGLAGPTGGYLVGFLVGVWVVSGTRGGRGAGVGRLLGAGALGVGSVFAFGVGWRVLWHGGNVGFAVATGFVPFVAKATIELCLAVAMVVTVRCLRPGRPNERRR